MRHNHVKFFAADFYFRIEYVIEIELRETKITIRPALFYENLVICLSYINTVQLSFQKCVTL